MSSLSDMALALDAKLMTSQIIPIRTSREHGLATMKKNAFIYFSFMTLMSLQIAACVSIGVGQHRSKKSDAVELKPPDEPFEEVEVVNLDQSWTNPKNGNTISYISECELKSDSPLKSIFQSIISSLDDAAIIEESNVYYNAREAYQAIVEGRVDGVLTRFQLLIFKKNNCNYILTYTAVAKSFADNQKQFQKFVKGFKVL
jgi:hypothetical protein